MKNLQVQNYSNTKKEIISHFEKSSFYFDQQENKSDEVSFSITRNERNAIAYDLLIHENYVLFQGERYVIKQVSERVTGHVLTKTITAIHESMRIVESYQYDTISGTFSINQCLEHIFKTAKGFTYEVNNINGAFTRVEQENFGDKDCKSLLEEVVKDYDAVVTVSGKHFTFIPARYNEHKTELQIRYKYNTTDVQFDIDTYELRTQIKGFGKRKDPKEGQEVGDWYFQPITYTSPEAEIWGIRIQDSIQDDRYTVASNMKARLMKELKDKPDVVGSVTLNRFSEAQLGDLVRFVYEPAHINEFIRVVGRREYSFTNKPPEITMANNKQTLTDYLKRLYKGGH